MAILLLSPAASTQAAERWVEVRSPRFVLLSNGSEKTARRAIAEFEQIHVVFNQAIEAPPIELPVLTVFAVDNDRTLGRLLSRPARNLAGVFRRGMFRRDATFRLDLADSLPTIYHEYFHVVANYHNPGLPRWLSEGLAEFWANSNIRDDRVEVGLPDAAHIRNLRNEDLLPIEELLTANPGASDGHRTALFYAQSWALVHYALLGKDDRKGMLLRFVELHRAGLTQTQAASQAFGDLKRLRTELRLYVGRPTFPTGVMNVPIDFDEASLISRKLSESEAAVAVGTFMLNGRRPEDAEPLFLEVLESDSDDGHALEGMGLLEVRRRNPQAAKEWLARAVERESASHLAHCYYAILIGSSSAEEADLAEQHLLHAVLLDSRFALGYASLARFYEQRDTDPRRSLSMAARAVRSEPDSMPFRSLHARLLEAAGQEVPARKGIEEALRLALASRPEAANSLCWSGSLAGFATLVMPACEMAVNAAPDNTDFRDSRGVARALSGDFTGAIADFRAFVEAPSEGAKHLAPERQDWLTALEGGNNPLNDPTLERLRDPLFGAAP